MRKKIKIRIGFPFCVTALILLSGNLRNSYICAFVISLLHETGHLIAMLFCGVYPDSVVFTPTGIRIDCPTGILSCRNECIISFSGPVVNLILMPFLLLFFDKLPFVINAGLLFINLLPLKSLDAGRFLYNLLIILKDEFYAEQVMKKTETAVCVIITAVLVLSIITGFVNPSFVVLAVMIVVTTVVQLVK